MTRCSLCGLVYDEILDDSCPYCKMADEVSSIPWIDNSIPNTNRPTPKKEDIYDWDNPNNCSDREYMDDDDYDDFDHT